MAPLFVLIGLFCLLYITKRLWFKRLDLCLVGLIPVSLLLIIAGTAHFFHHKTMIQMMPGFLPFKLELIYATGIFELLATVGLLIKRFRSLSSVLLIIFLLAVLPANIIGSIKKLPVAGMDKGGAFLYFRVPLQFFFMWWVYYFGIIQGRRQE